MHAIRHGVTSPGWVGSTVPRKASGKQQSPARGRGDRNSPFWQKLRQEREDLMRFCLLLVALMLVGCSDDSMTRNFGLNRDATSDNLTATRPPLSVPPTLGVRPARAGAPDPLQTGQQPDQAAGSPGQDALVEFGRAAGNGAYPYAHQRKLRNDLSFAGLRRCADELDPAAGLHAADRAAEEGMAQPAALNASSRTSAGKRPCARRSRNVVARSRLARRRPVPSVSRG